jgi:hypothetical protein
MGPLEAKEQEFRLVRPDAGEALRWFVSQTSRGSAAARESKFDKIS